MYKFYSGNDYANYSKNDPENKCCQKTYSGYKDVEGIYEPFENISFSRENIVLIIIFCLLLILFGVYLCR